MTNNNNNNNNNNNVLGINIFEVISQKVQLLTQKRGKRGREEGKEGRELKYID